MTVKEIEEKLVSTLKRWQKIEDESVLSSAEVMQDTDNPLVRTVMEIIQNDSQNHRRVQELIIRSHESEGFRLTLEQLGEISKYIERHVTVEKRMQEAVEELLKSIEGKGLVLHEYLLNYLQEDEQKHMHMLEALDGVKKKMHPVGHAE